MVKKPFFLTALLVALTSCSIKEDRLECPCRLSVNTSSLSRLFSPAQLGNRTLDVAGFDREERIVFDRFVAGSRPIEYDRKVKRERLAVAGVCSDREPVYDASGRVLSVSEGNQSDSLYVGTVEVDASGETACVSVNLHKQFTTLSISSISDWEVPDDCMVEVSGLCAGFDILTLKPLSGNFRYRTSFGSGKASLRLPRHDNDDILLSIYSLSDGKPYLSDFPIGSEMTSAGYDFNSVDLADVDLSVNLITGSFHIIVREWSGETIVIEI